MEPSAVVEINLPYVYQDVDRHGRVRVYFWRGRGTRKIRIREPIGSAEFMMVYHRLKAGDLPPPSGDAGPPRAQHGTLRWLTVQYFASPAFKRLDARTQYVRRGILELCCQEQVDPDRPELYGDYPLPRFTAKAVRVLRDRKADFPEAGNSRVKALRRVLAWAVEDEIAGVSSNVAADVKYVKSNGEGWHSWTVEEVHTYEQRHLIGTKARMALDLLLYTGVRRSDVVRLGRQHARGGVLRFRAFKGRNKTPMDMVLPILPVLAASIAAAPTGDLTFIVTEFGKPFTHGGFGNWFRRRCDEAGLPRNCSAHGLRKAGAARAAENGATSQQLMSIFGWLTLKEAERYTQAANRARMAAAGMGHLNQTDTG